MIDEHLALHQLHTMFRVLCTSSETVLENASYQQGQGISVAMCTVPIMPEENLSPTKLHSRAHPVDNPSQ